MRRTSSALLAVSMVVAAGMGTEEDALAAASPSRVATVPAPASELTRVDLVVIGDNLMDPWEGTCPEGCVSFVNQYAFFLRDTFGVDTYSYSKAPPKVCPRPCRSSSRTRIGTASGTPWAGPCSRNRCPRRTCR